MTRPLAAPPVPPEVPEVHPEGDFIEGEDALVIFYFHANPGPTELVWNLADIAENLTSTETNMTATAGRYTSEGWNATVLINGCASGIANIFGEK